METHIKVLKEESEDNLKDVTLKLNPKSSFLYQSPGKNKMKLEPQNGEQMSNTENRTLESCNLSSSSSSISRDKNNSNSSFSRSNSPIIDVGCSADVAAPLPKTSINHIGPKVVEPRPKSKPEEYVIYKSMSYLPFTTRFEMLKRGTALRLADVNPRQAVKIMDSKPPEFSNKKWRILKYLPPPSPSDSSSSEPSSPECSKSSDIRGQDCFNITKNQMPDINNNSLDINNNTIKSLYQAPGYNNNNMEPIFDCGNSSKGPNCVYRQANTDVNNNVVHNSRNNNSPHQGQNEKSQEYYRFTISRQNEKFLFQKRKINSDEINPQVIRIHASKKLRVEKVNEQPIMSEDKSTGSVVANKMQEEKLENKLNKSPDSEFKASEAAEILLSIANSNVKDLNVLPPAPSSRINAQKKPETCNYVQQSPKYGVSNRPNLNSVLKRVIPSVCRIKKIVANSNSGFISNNRVVIANPTAILPRYNIKPGGGHIAPSNLNPGSPSTSTGVYTNRLIIKTPPSSTYITLVRNSPNEQPPKLDKTEQMKLKNQQFLNQNKPRQSIPALQEDPEFESFASSWHDLSVDISGNAVYKCLLCSKVYTIYDAFVSHVRIHYKQQNKCSVCGKVFSRSWLLKGHMRIHTGERPYVCDHPGCHRAFADRSNLRSHMMIHQTKDKQHVCPYCDRAFAQKRYLHKHISEVCKAAGCDSVSNGSTASSCSQNTQNSTRERYRKVLPKQSVSGSPCSTSMCSTDSQFSQ